MITKPTIYSKEIEEKICDLIATGEYTIAELCKSVGISESLYYNWKRDIADFVVAIKKADEKRLALFKTEARKSALKKIQGYDYEEVSTVAIAGEDGQPKIKEKRITKKHVPPDTTMLIFMLKNVDNENFADRAQLEHSGTIQLPIVGMKIS